MVDGEQVLDPITFSHTINRMSDPVLSQLHTQTKKNNHIDSALHIIFVQPAIESEMFIKMAVRAKVSFRGHIGK